MIYRIDPPIPLRTSKGFGYAHFLDDPGDERDCIWGVFLESGEIWWVPNPKVRACRNFSLGRTNPDLPPMEGNMAKKMTLKKYERSAADRKEDRHFARKAGISEKEYEGSAADMRRDRAAVKKANKKAAKKGRR